MFSKNSTNQGNITILRQIFFFFIKNTKKPTLQQVIGRETPALVLKRMLQLFLKIPSLKKN